ncbi:MBG domain-containing protein [Collinsella aerofaciens]|uniref:MBG domain-containing protein n=1 Tax=Collinsella aerofaciens TaxID=74426 RepID=UPI00359C8A75
MLSLTLCSIAALSATLFAGTPSTNAYAGETVSHDLYAKTQLTLSLDVDNKYYDGKELKPEYKAIDPTTGDPVEVKGEVSYVKVTGADGKSIEPEKPLDGAPKDAGTYRVTYTVTGTDNYLGGSISQDVRIYRALPNPESPALEPIKFREGLKASEEPFPAQPEDGTWSWTRRVANQVVEKPGVVTALAMFTPNNTNYAVVYRYLTFEAYKDAPSALKRLKLTITAKDKTYDGQPYSDSLVTTTAVDAETGEPVEVKGKLTFYRVKKNNDRDDPWWNNIFSSAGGHEVTWTVESTDEYLGGEVSTRFLIEQAPAPTITVNDATGTWHGSEPAYTYTVSGLIPADEGKTVLAKGTKAVLDRDITGDKGYQDLDAGVYAAAITVKDPQLIRNAGGDCSNYKNGIFVKAGTLTVAPVTPTATVTAKNKTYDGTPAEVTGSITDPTSGKKLDSSYTLTYYRNNDGELEPLNAAPVDAGSYTVVMNVPARTNYNACEARCDFTIAKAAAPTITVKDASGTWRGSEPKYAYTVSGLVDADKDKNVLAEGTKAELDQHITGDKGYKDLDAGVYTSAITVKNPQLNKDAGSNYENGITVKAGTLTIAPVTPTATVTATGKTYDGAPAEVTCSITDPITGEKLDSAYSLTYYRKKDGKLAQLDGAPVDAGSYTVVMNAPARTNYNACEARCEFTIAKAPAPTITANDVTVTWRDAEPAYTYTVSGLVPADKDKDVLAKGTKAELDRGVTGDKGYQGLDAGVYASAITVKDPQLNKSAGANYENAITVIAGTLTVSPLTPKAAVDAAGKTYDGTPAEVTCSVIDPTSGEKLDSSYSLTYYRNSDGEPEALDGAPVDAGSYTVVMNVPAQTNYSACEARCDFAIAKAAAPTICVDSIVGAIGAAEPAYTFTVDGLKGKDTREGVLAPDTVVQLDTTKTDGKTYAELGLGTYKDALTVVEPRMTSAGSNNYKSNITVKPGTLTVKSFQLDLSVKAVSKTYDGDPAKVSFTITEPNTGKKFDAKGTLSYVALAGDTATPLAEAPTDAGTYKVILTVEDTGGYHGGTAEATFSIDKATPTLKLEATSKVYDGNPAKITTKVLGVDDKAIKGAGALTFASAEGEALAESPVNAGSYTVTLSTAESTNYRAAQTSKDFTIAKAAAPTITVKDASVVFGEPEPAYSYEASGLAGNDNAEDVIAQGTTAALDSKLDYSALDAGEHKDAITVANPQLSENGAINYEANIKVVPGTLTIEPANVTGAIAVEDKTYDGKPVEPAVEIANAAGKKVNASHEVNYYLLDGKERTEDLGAAAPKNAGSYEAVLRVTDTVNYRADEASCTFTIAKAPAPTITANDVTVTWRDAEPAYTYTVSGLVPADKDKDVLAKGTKAELDRGVTGDKGYQGLDAGVYASAITVKDPQLNKSAGANYENAITVIAGTLTVSPLTPKAAVDAAGKTYDGTPAEVTCSVIDPTSGEKLDSSYSLTYYRNSDGEPEALDGAPVDAGSYTVVMNVPAQTNYGACEARCDFAIAKAAAPTITVKDASVVFGEPEPAYSFKVNGLVGGDKAEDVIAQGTTAALDSKLDYGALDAGKHKDAITVANPQLSENGAVNYEANIKVVAGTLTIEPANVTGTIAVEDKTYDGKPVEPAAEIANAAGKKVNASYEVNYYLLDGDERSEDLGAAAPKNAGSYEAVLRVTDTVNYRADEASCTFTIGKAAAPTITVEDATGTWRGSEPKYVVTVEGLADGETADSVIQSTAAALDFQKISQDTGSDVTSYADLAVGTYADAITVANAQLTDAGKVNYQSGITVIPGTLTIEVTPLTLKLDVASKTYDGAPVAAVWSVVDPLTGNALNDLGTLTYYEIVDGVPTKLKEAPTNAGTYLAELSANVPASYTAEPVTASFSIYRATPNPDTPQLDNLELRDGLTFADVTIPNDPNGSWSWADSTCAITEAGTESGLAIYTPVDMQNFSRTTRVLSFNVVDGTEPSPEPTPGKPKPTLTIEVTSKVYDGAPASITTEVHDAMPMSITTEARDSATGAAPTVNGTLTYFEVTDDSFTKLDMAPVNAGHYAVLFEVAETDEYAAGSVTTIFDIYRAAPTPQAAPHPDPTTPGPTLPDLPLTGALKLGDQQLPADDEGTWAWVAPETALTATGNYRFLACYTPNDARNYASVFGWWTVNVVDAAEPNPEPTPSPTPNPADPGNTKTTKTVTTTTSTASKIPNTGDRTLAIVASLGIAGGIIVAAALMFIKRRA